MRRKFPKAKFILYLWDSVKNVKTIRSKFKFFDRLFSFDSKDVKRYSQLEFLPLFFINDFLFDKLSELDTHYDFAFIGTLHSNRFSELLKFFKFIKKLNSRVFLHLYVQTRFQFYFFRYLINLTNIFPLNSVRLEKISQSEIIKIYKTTKVVVDFSHPKQSGLTMRTIECIGLNKKIITNNNEVKNYSFYNSNNIFLFEERKTRDLKLFLAQQTLPYQNKLSYNIDNFISTLFN
jgi:hypothetical protein